eukprot:767941-Hanusia_phi.AAC.1
MCTEKHDGTAQVLQDREFRENQPVPELLQAILAGKPKNKGGEYLNACKDWHVIQNIDLEDGRQQICDDVKSADDRSSFHGRGKRMKTRNEG